MNSTLDTVVSVPATAPSAADLAPVELSLAVLALIGGGEGTVTPY
jgi:hypothetical protein